MGLNTFFNQIRTFFPGKRLTTAHVENIKIIIDTFQREYPDQPASCLAYLLATAYHETAHTFLPIKERGGRKYANHNYGVEGRRPGYARKMGNTKRGDGAKYMGRGLVQLTWKCNYLKLGDHVGVDLISNPNLAMRIDIAVQGLVYGCMEGIYSGRALTKYCNETKADFVAARIVVNGDDCDQLIANHANNFMDAIDDAGGVKSLHVGTKIIPDDKKKLPKEQRKSLIKSRTLFGHVLAVSGTVGGVIMQYWETIKKIYDASQEPIEVIRGVFGSIELNSTTMIIILVLTGLAISSYAKVDDNSKGKVA